MKEVVNKLINVILILGIIIIFLVIYLMKH